MYSRITFVSSQCCDSYTQNVTVMYGTVRVEDEGGSLTVLMFALFHG